jgi:hypothetical protein
MLFLWLKNVFYRSTNNKRPKIKTCLYSVKESELLSFNLFHPYMTQMRHASADSAGTMSLCLPWKLNPAASILVAADWNSEDRGPPGKAGNIWRSLKHVYDRIGNAEASLWNEGRCSLSNYYFLHWQRAFWQYIQGFFNLIYENVLLDWNFGRYFSQILVLYFVSDNL